MKKTLVLVSFIWISIFLMSCLQSKTRFKKIEYGYFKPLEKNDSLQITEYSSIEMNGNFLSYDNDEEINKYSFSKGILPDQYIQTLIDLFDASKKMKKYEISTKLKKNEFFAGDYFFIKIDFGNNIGDSLCSTRVFLDSVFNNKFDKIEEYIDSNLKIEAISRFNIPDSFVLSLKSAYKKCDYLPEITQPGSFIKSE